MALLAGVAREIITPKIGGFLFGYNDHQVSHSVHDDLTVTALVLNSGDTTVVLLSAIVCLVQNTLADEIRKKVSKALDIPAEHVILSATHTHSGPRTDGFSKWGSVDSEYCKKIFVL